MSVCCFRKWSSREYWLWTVVALCWLTMPRLLEAQEISGFSAATALEQVVVDAITKCEKSVVAVARLRANPTELGAQLPAFLNLDRMPGPTDPDFIPNEFG